MVVYTLEQRWEVGLRSTYRRCRFWQKKNHLFRWSSFWSWRVFKQAKLSHLGRIKPARIHWKADTPKTSHCLVRILVQRHNWAIFIRKWAMAIFIGPCWTDFCLQKLKRRILAIFGFNRTALRGAQSKLHSMFCALLLQIVWPPLSCDLTPWEYYLWDAVKDMYYANKPETIDALKNNMRWSHWWNTATHNR